MNLSINANGFSNVQNTAAGHKAEQANKQGKSAFFAGSPVLTTKNQIEQRKKMAQKSALKLVKDAGITTRLWKKRSHRKDNAMRN